MIVTATGLELRALDGLPRQGDRAPWQLNQDYRADVRLLVEAPVDDPALEFMPTPATGATIGARR